jgi:hypothetical protein
LVVRRVVVRDVLDLTAFFVDGRETAVAFSTLGLATVRSTTTWGAGAGAGLRTR